MSSEGQGSTDLAALMDSSEGTRAWRDDPAVLEFLRYRERRAPSAPTAPEPPPVRSATMTAVRSTPVLIDGRRVTVPLGRAAAIEAGFAVLDPDEDDDEDGDTIDVEASPGTVAAAPASRARADVHSWLRSLSSVDAPNRIAPRPLRPRAAAPPVSVALAEVRVEETLATPGEAAPQAALLEAFSAREAIESSQPAPDLLSFTPVLPAGSGDVEAQHAYASEAPPDEEDGLFAFDDPDDALFELEVAPVDNAVLETADEADPPDTAAPPTETPQVHESEGAPELVAPADAIPELVAPASLSLAVLGDAPDEAASEGDPSFALLPSALVPPTMPAPATTPLAFDEVPPAPPITAPRIAGLAPATIEWTPPESEPVDADDFFGAAPPPQPPPLLTPTAIRPPEVPGTLAGPVGIALRSAPIDDVARLTGTVALDPRNDPLPRSTAARPVIIAAHGVTRSFAGPNGSVDVLRGIDLEIEAGEFAVIMGPSGSGKTTLLHCLSGLDAIDEGEVVISGESIHALSDAERSLQRAEVMGFVFQAYHLVPGMTAVENVELPLLLNGWTPEEAREEASAALQLVGLTHRADHPPTALSGGEQQRVTIARALVGEPQIVWADEPTGNLDGETAAAIVHLLLELHAEGLTVVMATHDPRIAAAAERRIIVRDGRVVADDRSVAELPDRSGTSS